MKLSDKAKKLSLDPGVYMMKNSAGEIIYVGKAKCLKNRVCSYFVENKGTSLKTKLLMSQVIDFEIAITDNEVEALILEFNLIKKYRPKFNVRLKDDKSYPYVRIDVQHPFPKLEYTRKTRQDGARYFGPFVSAYELKDTLRWAQKAFKLRDCSDQEFRNRSRPCILHQMGQCSAPCVNLIKEKEYGENIEHALRLLSGKTKDLVGELKTMMAHASDNEEYERAAEFRDRIQKINTINVEQKITDVESDVDRDYVHFSRNTRGQAVAVVMAVREGRTVGVFQFPFDYLDNALPDREFFFQFLAQYYLGLQSQSNKLLPHEVLVPDLPAETAGEPLNDTLEDPTHENLGDPLKLLSKALSRKVDFRTPKRGEAKDFMEMVKKTADYHLQELNSKKVSLTEDLLDLQEKLDLHRFPNRIECYDISHFQGEGTVASRVVFIEGMPDKSLYRHYHVREAAGPDDFRSLREILERRFQNDHSVPDLVMIDGGKGQLAQAELIFKELGVLGVDLVSIAKARTTREFQESEVRASLERVFKPNQKNPIQLKPATGAHRILVRARDESHRFAISFHRRVRDRKRVKT